MQAVQLLTDYMIRKQKIIDLIKAELDETDNEKKVSDNDSDAKTEI